MTQQDETLNKMLSETQKRQEEDEMKRQAQGYLKRRAQLEEKPKQPLSRPALNLLLLQRIRENNAAKK